MAPKWHHAPFLIGTCHFFAVSLVAVRMSAIFFVLNQEFLVLLLIVLLLIGDHTYLMLQKCLSDQAFLIYNIYLHLCG